MFFDSGSSQGRPTSCSTLHSRLIGDSLPRGGLTRVLGAGVSPTRAISSISAGSEALVRFVITSYSIHYTKLYDISEPAAWLARSRAEGLQESGLSAEAIEALIAERRQARQERNFARADALLTRPGDPFIERSHWGNGREMA